MSFHAAGGNVGDTCKISLPKWVQSVGREDPDIYYTDRAGAPSMQHHVSLAFSCRPSVFWGPLSSTNGKICSAYHAAV